MSTTSCELCVVNLNANNATGIRPLVRDPNAKNTESLVRNHLVTVSDSGLLTCAGGKWTTYRQMAEDAVDKAIEVFKLKPGKVANVPDISGLGLFNDAAMLDGSCQTHRVRLIGAHGYSKTLFINLIQHFGLDADVAKHLAQSYGDRAWDVAALAASATKSMNYPFRGRKLSPTYPFIDGEVRYAVRSEYAQTAVDVLARRTRLSFLNAQAALEALPTVIDLMGEELQWNQARKDLEWTETVHFLASMGLPGSKLNLTREQVVSGETTALIEEPYSGQGKFSTAEQELKLMSIDSPVAPSRGAPDIRPEQNIGLEPQSPANIYP
jgi:glycerol-3-phosphate dehydrogenase